MKPVFLSLLATVLLFAQPLAEGQRALREGRLEAARIAFEARLAQAPGDTDALVGAGFTALRQDRLRDARDLFQRALALAPMYADAHFGLALVQERLGEPEEAKAAIRRALRLDPRREDFVSTMERILSQAPDLPPIARPRELSLDFRVSRAQGFEVRSGTQWKSIFLKGINLGAALPGKNPSEFPDKATYQSWIKDMAELGVNCVRVYTIHPPAFYEALREHNLVAASPIYLVHGVWIEPPPHDDFGAPGWFEPWKLEMRRVVDLLHGRGWLRERPGHASGLYLADVTPWTLAYILGREWEPFNVVGFNGRHPGLADWRGRFVTVSQGHATEVFMAQALEALLAYEHDTYHAQRPAAFTNWPTLDPLFHPTEATKEEEAALRKRLGMPLEPGAEVKEYDNDALGLDMEKYASGVLFKAGLFASYHAYPYYPDFLNLDAGYLKGADPLGPNNYVAYLRELVRHHTRHAVVISEFGVPSSRLVAHWQPQGLTHGGQNEREQGEQDARMFRNIHDSGCAGGMLFAWIDEWFKKNWLVIDFEEPLDRKPFWYNAQDAEENYGLLGAHPGKDGPTILIDGKTKDWEPVPVYLQGQGLTLKLTADEGWLHLGIFYPPAAGPRDGFLVGLDTYDRKLGSHALPWGLGLKSAAGLEFLVRIQGDRAAVLVDAPYDLFTHRYARPYRSVENEAGNFVMPRTESNRGRIGRDGTLYPPRRQEIGWLRRGTQDRQDPAFDSNAEWMEGPGFIEVRIPWGLLNVTDPSSHRVVHDPLPLGDGVGTRKTEGFRAILVRFQEAAGKAKPQTVLPRPTGKEPIPLPPLFTWTPWQQPGFHVFRKQSFEIVKEALRSLPDRNEGGPPGRSAPSAMKGGTACLLRSLRPPFDPHVVSGSGPDTTSASPLVLPHADTSATR